MWENWGPFSRYDARDDEAVGYEAYERRNLKRPVTWQSLVHSGAAHSAFLLSTHVLGVRPTGPGFTSCTIRPRPGDLPWARGVFPTPHGDIGVDWHRDAQAFAMTVDVPTGIKAEVMLDREAERPQTLAVNGSNVDLGDAQAAQSASALLEPASVRVRIGAGHHTLELGGL